MAMSEPPVRSGNVKLFDYHAPDGTIDRARYAAVQSAGNRDKIDNIWAREENIRVYADYLRARGPISFGICHGTRRGLEQKWFAEALGCDMLGTEIAPTAADFPNTIRWDFHDVKPEWLNAADFIYSNSFDHTHSPEHCLEQWMSCIRSGGVCLIEHSDRHGPAGASELDPFGIELPDFVLAVARWGKGRFWVRELLENLPFDRRPKGYLCCLVIEKAAA